MKDDRSLAIVSYGLSINSASTHLKCNELTDRLVLKSMLLNLDRMQKRFLISVSLQKLAIVFYVLTINSVSTHLRLCTLVQSDIKFLQYMEEVVETDRFHEDILTWQLENLCRQFLFASLVQLFPFSTTIKLKLI